MKSPNLSKDIAKQRVAAFRNSQSSKNTNQGKPGDTFYTAEFFDKESLLKVLNQPDCDGIRIYHALNDDEKHTLLIVGVSGVNDMVGVINTNAVTNNTGGDDTTPPEDIILESEENQRCPPTCTNEGGLG